MCKQIIVNFKVLRHLNHCLYEILLGKRGIRLWVYQWDQYTSLLILLIAEDWKYVSVISM